MKIKVLLGSIILTLAILFTGCEVTVNHVYEDDSKQNKNQTAEKKATDTKKNTEEDKTEEDSKSENKKESSLSYKCNMCCEIKKGKPYYTDGDIKACKKCRLTLQESDEVICKWCGNKFSGADGVYDSDCCSTSCYDNYYGTDKSDDYEEPSYNERPSYNEDQFIESPSQDDDSNDLDGINTPTPPDAEGEFNN